MATRGRALRSLVTATAAAALLAACGGTGGETAPQGGRESFKGQQIRVLLKEGYEINAIQEFLPDFEAATGIDVELEVYDESTARQKLALDMTSRTGTYDVTSASFWNLPEFTEAGWLEPLDPYLEQAKDPWLHKEDIPGGALDSMSVDGKLYALPHTIIGGLFYYRADVLERHGIQPPTTTDEILAAAKALKQAEPDMVPFVARGASSFASLGTQLGWAYGYGAVLMDGNGQPHADDPKMAHAMQDFVTLMRDYGPTDAASLDFTQAGEKFSSGRAAMMFDTSGFGTIFEDPAQSKVAGKVGYTLPTGPEGKKLQWLYNEGLAVTATSEHKNAAWLFLQWRMSRETTTKELTQLGRTDVPNLHVLGSDEYKKYAREHNVVAFTEILPKSWEAATAEHWPFYAQFAQIGDTFCQNVSRAITGSTAVEGALKDSQATLAEIMRNNR
ncbi:ABC transporter substrate-binding protein [Saccharothrix obliqua]|uniref:ABC transporter substrate-binding protein n=1 Tax=Saccharothrix obliqua TaxID=2861747 RepID=UPI001C5E1497|nr:sugar ABC transporter substrate-binding protein [Saccharothrix obliqua]MBW4721376.1 sugar ABC transporter substrate-binding protein [Saccharothrix obliqua]